LAVGELVDGWVSPSHMVTGGKVKEGECPVRTGRPNGVASANLGEASALEVL
jgi:hypothetical protein